MMIQSWDISKKAQCACLNKSTGHVYWSRESQRERRQRPRRRLRERRPDNRQKNRKREEYERKKERNKAGMRPIVANWACIRVSAHVYIVQICTLCRCRYARVRGWARTQIAFIGLWKLLSIINFAFVAVKKKMRNRPTNGPTDQPTNGQALL